ncbi:MAG: vitamin B12 dependent-methionine synthase activation domain-containing protein [Dysgonomonas sp.]|nr:vitamin B12 dependent-methionine synthase activation domain-containing protein [Dysgonomonas sp.]
MVTRKIPFSEVNLSKTVILSEMGYGKVSPDKPVLDALDELYLMLNEHVVTEYVFNTCSGEMYDSFIQFGDVRLDTGSMITPLLKNSLSFSFFVATVGHKFDEIMQKIKTEGDMLKIYILDTLGTCLVEKVGDMQEAHLEEILGGVNHTHRFSPGYCGWPLTDQRQIFALMRGNTCGIELSDVCLMHPIKSISGIIGIGDEVSRKLYGCHFCELETCYKRKRMKV